MDPAPDRFLANVFRYKLVVCAILKRQFGQRGRIVDSIRVQFGPMPTMLRTIMRDLLRIEPDIEIVGTTLDRSECLHAARKAGADILLVQDEVQEGASCLDLILARQDFGLLGVAVDGRSATSFSFARQTIRLDAGRPSNLADAIRTLVANLRVTPSERPTQGAGPARVGTGIEPMNAIDQKLDSPSGGR